MTADEIRQSYVALLRGMLSHAWQQPSDRKIAALLKSVETAEIEAATPQLPSERVDPAKRRRQLTALVVAGTKLDAASRFAKEATVDLALWGQSVGERARAQKIAAEIDDLVARLCLQAERIP